MGKLISFRRFAEAHRRRKQPLCPFDAYRRFWGISLDRLTDYIAHLRDKERPMTDLKIVAPPGESYIVLTRTFNAPLALVWRAVSEPEHIVRWWGPHGYKNRVLELDFRVNGIWKIETTTQEGHVVVFHGEYREIEPPSKVVQTFGVEGMYDGAYSVDTLTLEEIDGKTQYKVVSVLPDVAARDGMMASGMEVGVIDGFERLDSILEEFKAGR